MTSPKHSIFFLGLLSAFSLITFDLYQPSLPFIADYFHVTPDLAQLSLNIYLCIFGVTHLLWGPLVDHFGRRKILPIALVIAFMGSIVCALATDIYLLLLGRALQGFALCAASLIAYSSARDYEDPIQRANIISYINMVVSASPILAPVLGALVFTYLGWQANFILMALLALILYLQGNKTLIESPDWQPPKKSFSLQEAFQDFKFVCQHRGIWYGSFIMMFSFNAVMLTILHSSYLIIGVLHYSPLSFGLIFILNGLNIIFGNYVGIWLRERLSMQATMYMGNVFIILGGTALLLTSHYFGFSLYALAFTLVSNLGISISAPPTMSLALNDFPKNAGTATSFINTIRLLGSSICTSFTGYWILKNTNVLPFGLILSGIGALFFSWLFNQKASVSTNHANEPATV